MQTTHFLLIWQQQKVSRGLSNLIMRGLCYVQFCRLRSGHGFIPCCEIWLLPEALWKSCFLLCSTMCKPPCWEKQGILLNCIHLFLSFTIWNREKRICRAIFPSYFFYFWEGTRMVTNTFLRMCWLMKSVRNLIFGGQSDRLGRWSRQQLWTHWKDDGRKTWIFLSPPEIPRPQCRRKNERRSVNHPQSWYNVPKSMKQ